MLKKFFLGVAAVVFFLVLYGIFQPAHYSISRELVIQAPAEKIFPYLNNSRKFETWSPWSELDPKAKMEFSGPEEGVGAKTSWTGGDKLGTGSATIVESMPNHLVKTHLVYEKPFVMEQWAALSLSSAGDTTTVKWTVEGENKFMGRIMCLFMNMDKMVGGNFEKGLAKLKSLVE